MTQAPDTTIPGVSLPAGTPSVTTPGPGPTGDLNGPQIAADGSEGDPRGIDGAIARLFASGLTYTQISEQLRVSRSTVARRLADPDVRRKVQVEADRRVSDIVGELSSGATAAVLLLTRVVSDSKASDTVRVRASDVLLSHYARFTVREADPVTTAQARADMTERLRAYLERKMSGEPTVAAYLADPAPTEGTDPDAPA